MFASDEPALALETVPTDLFHLYLIIQVLPALKGGYVPGLGVLPQKLGVMLPLRLVQNWCCEVSKFGFLVRASTASSS